jgi:mannose-binding lectin 2
LSWCWRKGSRDKMFGKQWTSLCLLAGSLTGALGLGLEEHPDIKAITVSLARPDAPNTC